MECIEGEDDGSLQDLVQPAVRSAVSVVSLGRRKHRSPSPASLPAPAPQRKVELDLDTGRAGGVYIPPFKLARMMKNVSLDKNLEEFQRMHWDALRKSINGLVNKVNIANIQHIIPELFKENIVRGRGLLVRSLMKAQMASPAFSHVYAALIAVLNTKLPEIGELVVKRVIGQFKRAFRRNDKMLCLACTKFLAHLVNQQVAHEIVALELVYLLLDKPTDDSVEVAIGFVKECGNILTDLIPKGVHAIFERFRGILQEGIIDTRVQYLIEGLFVVRKNKFEDYPTFLPELDLVEAEDQIPHEVSLNDSHDPQSSLDVFHYDPEWELHEKQYDEIRTEILGESDEEEEEGEDEAAQEQEENEAVAEPSEEVVEDFTSAEDVQYRKRIYLAIMSSANFEECAHKLIKILREGKEKIMGEMLLEACMQEKIYVTFYGLVGERFCRLSKTWHDVFDDLFAEKYATMHRYEINKIRNLAKFFGHLLQSDALSWGVMEYILLTEDDTTSSSRIFIMHVFQELCEVMGMQKLKQKLFDPENQHWFTGIFPLDDVKNTRFAINFFTAIKMGELT